MKKKKILILGGAGYIGTVLCNYLVNKKYDIKHYIIKKDCSQ